MSGEEGGSFAELPPQNLDAEESVIGSMLISEPACDVALDVLDPADFYRESHAKMFRAIASLRGAGSPADAITLASKLEELGMLDEVGGKSRVHELATLVPAASNVRHYATIVREAATLRHVKDAADRMAMLVRERGMPAAEIVDEAERLVFDVSRNRSRSEFIPIADALDESYRELLDRHERGEEIVGVASGFRALDALTSGFQPGNLVIAAGRPSMGKSGFALCAALNVALRSGLPVAVFTMEMSRKEVAQRFWSSEAQIDSRKLRNGSLNGEEWARVTTVTSRLRESPLMIDDNSMNTLAEIRSKSRRLKMRHPDLALVVVDYVQLIDTPGSSGGRDANRVQEVSAISRGLKVLAGELGTPVLALSQLSRAVEQRHDKRPILSDLRESGSLEQDADVVLLLYRDEYYNPEDTDQDGICEVNIAKHRNGPTGTVKLAFVKRYARFGDLHTEP